MPIEHWSESILLIELQDDPQFSDDLNAALDLVEERTDLDVVVSLSAVTTFNSSNVAKLLKLRKSVSITNRRRLKLCALSAHVWGVFLVTGLDKIFDVCDDVTSGLAGLQLGA